MNIVPPVGLEIYLLRATELITR